MSLEAIYTLKKGSAPLLVSMPHIGTEIPAELQPQYQPQALQVQDTDWHLDLLYNFLDDLGASVLRPRYSRYLIDLNRPPDDAPMYPGAANTELCPTRFFSGEPLYRAGCEPASDERAQRRAHYWQPYHSALAGELARLKAAHGFVLLWDAHSICAELPWLFDGRLPDLNIGTAGGASAQQTIGAAVLLACRAFPRFTTALNGRFKGGYITRHYGHPAEHVHAVQLEMCRCLYLHDAPPFCYDETLAGTVQPLLKLMLGNALAACRRLYET